MKIWNQYCCKSAVILACVLFTIAYSHQALSADSGSGGAKLPRPDHVVVVIEENKSFGEIIGSPSAPYINALAQRGAVLTNFFAITHPSQPNYLALFAGSTLGVQDNSCPHSFSGPNLAAALAEKGLTFGIYSESMPSTGFTGCHDELYKRKHNPVPNWQGAGGLDAKLNMTFEEFPKDYAALPTIAWVVPNQDNDMHNGHLEDSVPAGDAWLKINMDAYVDWAMKHNSLLIIVWDEDDRSERNRIPAILVGPMVKPGTYDQKLTLYSLLRTMLDMYGLKRFGEAKTASPIADIWTTKEPVH